MSSSELVDSGMFSGHYLEGMDDFARLSLGLATEDFETKGSPDGTMNLLSNIEKSGAPTGFLSGLPEYIGGYGSTFGKEVAQNKTITRSEAETEQMVIFYSGQVHVFDDFTVDKANEILMAANTAENHQKTAFPPLYLVPSPAESTTNNGCSVAASGFHHRRYPQLGSDLPMKRKNSLARFLETRKHRIAAKSPYQQASNRGRKAPKGIEGEGTWLGLAPQFPFRLELDRQ